MSQVCSVGSGRLNRKPRPRLAARSGRDPFEQQQVGPISTTTLHNNIPVKTIELIECPYDWEVVDNGDEIILNIGVFHEHLTHDEYAELESKLGEGRLELQEKLRGGYVVATRLVERTPEGEILISEMGLLIPLFWKKKSFKFYPLKRAY